jgi:competence protein ComEA
MLSVTRAQVVGLLAPVLALLVFVGARHVRSGSADGQRVDALQPVVENVRGAGGRRLVVHVVGAVRRSGLYRLTEGARVDDAIRQAGGATPRADLALVNLAAPLVDGQQVVVPARVRPVGGDTAGARPESALSGPPAAISLGTATLEQLDTLPGIGPVTAQRIVDWRQAHGPFSSVDDLDAVPGIGEARIEQLRDLVTP